MPQRNAVVNSVCHGKASLLLRLVDDAQRPSGFPGRWGIFSVLGAFPCSDRRSFTTLAMSRSRWSNRMALRSLCRRAKRGAPNCRAKSIHSSRPHNRTAPPRRPSWWPRHFKQALSFRISRVKDSGPLQEFLHVGRVTEGHDEKRSPGAVASVRATTRGMHPRDR